MGSPVDEGGRSMRQSSNALLGDKDRVAGGFGELLDAGCHVDGVTDEGELELAAATDGSGDHHTGVDPDADAKLPAEPLRDEAVNQHRSAHSGTGMLREVAGAPKTASAPSPRNLQICPLASTTAGTTMSNNALRREAG